LEQISEATSQIPGILEQLVVLQSRLAMLEQTPGKVSDEKPCIEITSEKRCGSKESTSTRCSSKESIGSNSHDEFEVPEDTIPEDRNPEEQRPSWADSGPDGRPSWTSGNELDSDTLLFPSVTGKELCEQEIGQKYL